MKVVRLRSGLGNQMFQYAFFKQMQDWHGKDDVKLDIDTHHWQGHNGRELDTIFGIDFSGDTIPPKVTLSLADVGMSYRHRILRKIRGPKHSSYLFWTDLDLSDYQDLPQNVYIEGYWNEVKYFGSVQDEIRETYSFPSLQSEYHQRILNDIESSESIGIHVRRGDYVDNSNTFPMCEPAYYSQALSIINDVYPNTKSFVFSDDIEWCKEELAFMNNVCFVENKVSAEAYIDMMLMSRCKHNIMANSTFSWWSAWLNSNKQKIVIYPESALLTYASMPDDWIKI